MRLERVGLAIGLGLAIAIAAVPASVATQPGGLVVDRPRLRALGLDVPGEVVLVRADLRRFEPVVRTAREDGGARTLLAWAESQDLVAAVNAAMFEVDGTASGLLRRAGRLLSERDRPDFGGLLGLDPAGGGLAPARVLGRDCPRDARVDRARYQTWVQSLRLLDCSGRAIDWVDPDRYAASGVGVDRRGHLVLMHSATELRMRELSRALAHPRARLAAMLFTEGGDKASLVVRAAGVDRVRRAGSHIDDDAAFVAIPLVLGLRPVRRP
jgi:hypothetical protein